jgi:multidrug efflux pump subunit AcrA (membrane-fusion protein)
MNYYSKLAAFIIIPLIFYSGCAKDEAPEEEVIRPVKAMQVGGMEELTSRSFPGQAKATREANLSFRVSGPLTKFPVEVGDEVKRGRLLARIDPRDFEVNLKNAQGQLEKSRAAVKLAQSDYDRVKRIAQVKSLQAEVAAAKDALSYTYLKAPFDGTIVQTFVENYEDVRAKQQIVRLVDTSKVEFIVNIPENLISYAPSITKVYVRFDTYPDKDIAAVIKEIGKEASRTTRTYPVTLIMDQPEGFKVLPGMAGRTVRAEGDLPAGAGREGYEVPVTAVFPGEAEKTLSQNRRAIGQWHCCLRRSEGRGMDSNCGGSYAE